MFNRRACLSFCCVFVTIVLPAQTISSNPTLIFKPGVRVLTALKSPLTSSTPPGTSIRVAVLENVRMENGQPLHQGSIILGKVVSSGPVTSRDKRTKIEIEFDALQIDGADPISIRFVIQAIAPPLNAHVLVVKDPSLPTIPPSPISGSTPGHPPPAIMRMLDRDDKGVFSAISFNDGSCVLCVDLETNEKTGKTLLYAGSKGFSIPSDAQLLLRVIK